MKKIIEKGDKNKRSISVSLRENKNNKINNPNEKENISNNNSNSNFKKGFHHRKRTSSYFLGSYLPGSNIIENTDINEKDTNQNNNKNENVNNNDKEYTGEKEIKNPLIYNLINAENSNNLSLSFPSYDEANNNSVIIKKEESAEKKQNKESIKNNNNIILEIAKNSENSTKSFITFKNSLKYIKDKDERTTPSYQLALQADKKEGNNCYVTSSNIIEEEKSSMLESKTEFSNKKNIIFSERETKQNEEKKENDKITSKDNNINNINLNNNWNYYRDELDDKNKMSLALNEIIIKNNKKEENRRKILTQNKMTLLNTFFTVSKPLRLNQLKENKNKENHLKKEKIISRENNFQYIEKKINNKLNFHSLTENEYIKNNTNNNEKNIETENTKKYKGKIPHYSNLRKISQKNKNDSPSEVLITTSYKGQKTTNSNNSSRNNLLSKKFNKILTKNDSSNRHNVHSLKRRENLTNALTFIKEKQRKKLMSDIDKRKYYSNNTYNCSVSKKITNVTYTNSLTNSNLNTNNSNTQSHSKSKEKSQKVYRKSNSGSFNSKGENISQIDDYITLESNQEKTIICLTHKLKFNKDYEKVDSLEQLKVNSLEARSFFGILCENKIDDNKYTFSGLYKFYKNKEKFIKIYGDEKNPNYISLKDIREQNKFHILEDNGVVNTFVNKFTPIKNFKFTKNAMIMIKN